MARILLVEDNPLTAKGLQYLLERESYQVEVARDAKTARERLGADFDLVLLDVGLPDGDGFQLAKMLKTNSTAYATNASRLNTIKTIPAAVIFLTAKDREEDIVHGLEIGADDYVVKPFHNRELLLRIQNVLRRKEPHVAKNLECGGMCLNPETREVMWRGEKIVLTALESQILMSLLEAPNQILTREKILDEIWSASGSIVNDNTVSVYIKRLREKLGTDTILTVKNLGYRLNFAEVDEQQKIKNRGTA